MKVGIITILKVNNYGAELQAYATQAVIKRMGYDAEIIDYLFYKHPKFIKTAESAPVFHFTLKQRIAEFLYPIVSKTRNFFANRKNAKTRSKRFNDFHNHFTTLSPTYDSINALYAAHHDYDVVITGSDQVWNPGIYSSLKPYFLDFAPKRCRKISYAASFGVSHLPDETHDFYKKHLESYHAIGVREKDAVSLVRQVADKDSVWVLDPTLLLTKKEWEEVSIPYATESLGRYLLIYELTPCSYITTLARHIARINNLKLVRICKDAHKQDKDSSIENIIDAGPSEFIHLMANASFIITNSFHGTAFCINFHKPFYTVLPLRKSNNSRQRSILELFNLTDRLLTEGDDLPESSINEIDFDRVQMILDEKRNESINFLKKALDEK